jgi:hypothetical protein
MSASIPTTKNKMEMAKEKAELNPAYRYPEKTPVLRK